GDYAILRRIVTAHIAQRGSLMAAPALDMGDARAGPFRRSRRLYALAALPPLVGVAMVLLAPQPHGHWVEHLSAAGIKAAQLAVLLTALALLGWRPLTAPLVAALLVVGAGIALQASGDAQVAGAIWRTTGNPSDADGYKAG